MTNEELDRWLVVNVMGKPPEDLRRMQTYGCEDCDQWHPTDNIAQAIDAAEKARNDGRILWFESHSPWECNASPSALVGVMRQGYAVEEEADAPTHAEALSRAIYEALTESS